MKKRPEAPSFKKTLDFRQRAKQEIVRAYPIASVLLSPEKARPSVVFRRAQEDAGAARKGRSESAAGKRRRKTPAIQIVTF